MAGRGHPAAVAARRRDHRRRTQIRDALRYDGAADRHIRGALDRVAGAQLRARHAGGDIGCNAVRAVAELAVRFHPLQAETIDLVVDECRRQGRPIPGAT